MGTAYELAMVTSTSTPVSRFIDVTCLTNSLGECKSIIRLCTRIWNLSQVLLPSPQGVLRVVMRSTLVGQRTGPCKNKTKKPLVDYSAHWMWYISNETTFYLDRQVQFLGAWNQISAYFFQWANIGWSQCDADTMHWRDIGLWFLQIFA